MENYDYFLGAMRFNVVMITIDVLLIIQFFVSWYISYKKTGWAIDVWNLTLLMTYFFPFLVLYPFASSIFNVISVGTHVKAIRGSINQAYFISLVGYMSYFLGSRIFKLFKFKTPIYWGLILPLKNTVGKAYQRVLLNKDITKIIFLIYCAALAMMLAAAYKAGSFNNPRAFFYKDDSIRAYYNLTVSLSGIVSGIIIARIFQFNLLSDKVYLGLFMFVNLFIGSRSFALSPLASMFTLAIFLVWKGRIKIKQMAIYGGVILALVVVLSNFRAGSTPVKSHAKELKGGPLTEILYGNTFSDLRDFAWCLSAWNGDYYYGKTYLSAFMSFVPSTLSPFRTEYGIGRITAKLGGFNPKEHPGLRPGMFGESYLNLGLFGVILVGILLGYGTRYMDYKSKIAASSNNKLEFFVAGVGVMVINNLSITSGFFTVYTFAIIICLLYVVRLFFKSFKSIRINATTIKQGI
ncbi:hypothetical protein [Mucilaginibacter jinjuensis]|uniref:Oligosaccharide repeat unit polymerase n=1 Tax=Mucilaginibacter jinjuensis TaxID=1176721 RepID=A0ABY7TIE3_9SPHI|nr:hypothetical protein [Mucilaginibacter jinjuensis]WCT14917.1 hypothetical protein PQO05_13320 [Mucilaginibacter jinjuensis]